MICTALTTHLHQHVGLARRVTQRRAVALQLAQQCIALAKRLVRARAKSRVRAGVGARVRARVRLMERARVRVRVRVSGQWSG